MKSLSVSDCVAALAVLLVSTASSFAADPGIVASEFIYEKAPFPQCHASTIAETKEGLVAAWFGGTAEKNKDVGIWISRRGKEGWSEVKEVANGKESDTVRYPCWNPVLFQMPAGPLLLFYKVGPSPSSWWGMKIESADGGKTWSQPTRLPDNIAGPIKNKPELLADGRLLCGSSTEDKGWRVHMEWTKDAGKTWERTEPICDGKSVAAIQPTILRQGKSLIILCRPRSVLSILRAESDRPYQPRLRHRRRHAEERPASAHLQSHRHRPQPSQPGCFQRRQDLASRCPAGKSGRRIFLPGHHPNSRRPRSYHLHLETAAGEARRG